MSSLALALLFSLPSTQPAPAIAAHAPAPFGAEDERLTLEELLERYRGRRDARLGELREEVLLLIAELEAQGSKVGARELEATVAKLRGLGGASAPLLVPFLEPGKETVPEDTEILRAQLVARVLRELPTFAVTNELLEMLKTGSVPAQLNAITVLARSDESGRVGPVLRDYVGKKKGSRRENAMRALAEIGDAESVNFLGTLLAGQDGELARQALDACTSAQSEGVAEKVHDLVRATAAGAAHVRSITGYYRACPQVIGEPELDSLLRLARGTRTSGDDAELLLDLIGEFHKQFSSSFKKDLRKLADSSDKDVAEGALVALVRSGDRTAKRELLEPYDERVAESRSWARSYEDRGDVYYRIGDYKSARKDYEDALGSGSGSSRDLAHVYLQIARCYALTGKLKDAKEWIEKAPITLGQRRALALDPAFVELVESSRYSDVFGRDN